MSTAVVKYLGGLRTACTHTRSGSTYITDAPVDNNGKGEAFSPTDSVAVGLANCMLTVMGIKARDLGVDLTGSIATVLKTMASNPRRISQIEVDLHMKGSPSEKQVRILENTGNTCPVHHSLNPDIIKIIHFHWD